MPADPIVNDHYGDVLWKYGNKIQARYYWNYVLNLKETEEDLKKKVRKKLILGYVIFMNLKSFSKINLIFSVNKKLNNGLHEIQSLFLFNRSF